MKHKLKITIILLVMFLITQFIGLAVFNADIFHIEQEVNGTIQRVSNPQLSWIQPPDIQEDSDFFGMFPSLVIAFIIAIVLLFLLSKFELKFILKGWFFVIICIALFLAIYAFEKIIPLKINSTWAVIIPALIAIPLAFIKVYRQNFLVHNITELFIYPGIAIVFVPILNFWTIIILLVLISIYDIWAVWHSGIMQKMAKYQINKLKIFGGFFVPYVSKKMREKIKKLRAIAKKSKKKSKSKKIKINIAMLGGGDIIFPIITSGVILNMAKNNKFPEFLSSFARPLFGIPGLTTALFVISGATLGLTYLFFFSEKKKFYPAMPFITGGIFIGLLLSYVLGFF
jgi:presenilin-like A22 family membrane protease